MKTILCYGDSNTWGYDAATEARFPYHVRWTGVLQRELGPEYQVISEGLNGRTTVWPDPVEGEHRNGKQYFWPCLESHAPVDLLVIMLGTNDLKHRFGLSPWDIARGVQTLAELALASQFGPANGPPQVLLVSPVLVTLPKPEWVSMMEGGPEKSLGLAKEINQVARTLGCHFMDAASFADPDPLDGIHIRAEGHDKLGRAAAECVRGILGN